MGDPTTSINEILQKSSISSGIEIQRLYKKHQKKESDTKRESNLIRVSHKTLDFLGQPLEQRLPKTYAVIKGL